TEPSPGRFADAPIHSATVLGADNGPQVNTREPEEDPGLSVGYPAMAASLPAMPRVGLPDAARARQPGRPSPPSRASAVCRDLSPAGQDRETLRLRPHGPADFSSAVLRHRLGLGHLPALRKVDGDAEQERDSR